MADFEYVACPKCHEKFMAGRNFFVCRKLTVIVLTAAMNFRSALLPLRPTKRPIDAPVEQRDDGRVSNHLAKRRLKAHEI